MNIKKIRDQILQEAKPIVVKNGWNDDLFFKISKSSKYKYSEIQALFPEGYIKLLEIYLEDINQSMSQKSKEINLIRLRVHERVQELLILRLKIIAKEKELFKKTFLYLALPHNFKISTRILYRAVDEIWFLSGDTSTDFNFYSKRAILATIYTSTIIHFVNNKNINETNLILKKLLKRVSLIPKIKNKFSDTLSVIPNILKISKNFLNFRQ
tara:strand:+ start:1179 stop:1814 length:636 start_codon:yes stop_codon:yes gene_type:complete